MKNKHVQVELMKVENYIQNKPCKFTQLRKVAWIPEEFAVFGKYLDLRDKDGNWDDGWKVIGVYHNETYDSDWIRERESDHKK